MTARDEKRGEERRREKERWKKEREEKEPVILLMHNTLRRVFSLEWKLFVLRSLRPSERRL